MLAVFIILLALVVIPVLARRADPAAAASVHDDWSVDRVSARGHSKSTAAPNQISALR